MSDSDANVAFTVSLPMSFTPDLLHELDILLRFDLANSQHGIKVHKTADAEVIAATQRLYRKGLLTQIDGGYLTGLGRDAAEHAQEILTILTSAASADVRQQNPV